jgi:hypothetical protein
MRIIAVIAALMFAQPAFAQTAEHLAAVERAAAVGWNLYEHDQAAWHGTDRMLEDVRDPRAEGFRGYFTERTPGGVQLIFVRIENGEFFAAYRALYRDGELREYGRVDQPLTDAQSRLFRAREIVADAPLPQQCAESYNIVTLRRAEPSADGVDVDVYMMPALAAMNEVPFGGHFRFGIDTNAGVIREVARFTNSCLTMTKEPNAAALVVSQIIGDTPTEVHVFESLTARIPVFVSSRSGIWQVHGRTIRYEAEAPSELESDG